MPEIPFLSAIFRFIFRKEKATVAIEGFDRFSARMESRLTATEKRLDECDEDRVELRKETTSLTSEVGDLRSRVKICEEDREDMRQKTNKHSVEISKLRRANKPPHPPHRTTEDTTE